MKKYLPLILIGAVIAGFFVWQVMTPHVSPSAVTSVLARTGHLTLFLALWLAAYFAGRGVVCAIRWRGDAPPPEITTALGVVVFSTVALALAAFQGAYVWVVRGIVIAVLAVGMVPWVRRWGSIAERVKKWFAELDAGAGALLVFAAFLAAPLLLAAAEPPFYWDASTYHLAVPRFYAEAHGFTYLPYNTYASMPLGATMFYLWGMLWDGYTTANACYLAVSLLAIAVTYRVARIWLNQFYAAIAAALVYFTPVVFIVQPGAHVDHFVMLYGAACLYTYFKIDVGVRSWRRALMMGIFLGAALAIKYTSIWLLAAFVPVFIWDLAKKRLTVRDVAVTTAIAFVFVVPWLVKAYVERGNPLFPLWYDVFGGRDFTAEQAKRLVAWQHQMGAGRGWSDYLLLPFRISVQGDLDYATFCGVYLPFLLPLAIIAAVAFRKAGRLVAFAWTFFLGWALGPQQLRFLGAGLVPLAVAAAGTLAWADAPLGNKARVGLRVALVIGVCFAGFAYNIPGLNESLTGYQYLAGMTAEDFLIWNNGVYMAEKYINENTPADAKVLMIFTNHTLYLHRPAVYDSFFEASPFLMAAEKGADARALYNLACRWGISYVYIYHYFEKKAWREYTPETRERFYDFIRRYCTPVYQDPLNDVYILTPPAG